MRVWLPTSSAVKPSASCCLFAADLSLFELPTNNFAVLAGFFYGVRGWDVPTLTAVASVLIVAALLASYIPARHAASINPAETLRSE
jgi:hypothetical protein